MKKNICLILVMIICTVTLLTVNSSAAIVEDNNATGYSLFGDVNRDKAINICDLVSLGMYENDSQIDICVNAADINGDGKISNKDLGEFRLSLLGVNDNFETGGDYWSDLY